MQWLYDVYVMQTFWYMMLRSMKVMAPTILPRMLNQAVWTTLNVVVFGYLMPQNTLGLFIAVTMPTSVAFFIAIHGMYGLLVDVTQDGSNLRYELSLPIAQWTVFFKYSLEYALLSLIVSSIVLPLGYVLTGMVIPITLFALFKFYLILFLTALFSGMFALFSVAIVKNVAMDLDNLWVRVLFPMWFLGCFQFSWKQLYAISPTLAYFDLLNPLTYALEGGRAALMFSDSSLNYWYCVIALMIYAILFGYIGIKKLMHRMDCL